MHTSRLAGFIIDCRDTDPEKGAVFWSAALNMPPLRSDPLYVTLDASARDLSIEVQNVGHESRLHLDIETDDIPAEVSKKGAAQW